MILYFTPEARRDLVLIGEWISQDNPQRAETFVDELVSSCTEILNFPEKYPFAAQFENRGLRRKVHGNYLIFYRVKAEHVEIIHVLHGAMDLGQYLI